MTGAWIEQSAVVRAERNSALLDHFEETMVCRQRRFLKWSFKNVVFFHHIKRPSVRGIMLLVVNKNVTVYCCPLVVIAGKKWIQVEHF